MGVKTTFGMCWWDPDALVKICFQKITLTNIFVRLVRVGQVGQVNLGLGLANVRGRFTCGWTACLPACLPEDGIPLVGRPPPRSS